MTPPRRPRDLVLEIGPGKGALTAKLAERAGMVVAVEIDGHLIKLSRRRSPAAPACA